MQSAQHNHSDATDDSPTELEISRFEDDGGPALRTEIDVEIDASHRPVRAANFRDHATEAAVLITLVLLAHLSPFSAIFGVKDFGKDACHSIAAIFGYLSAGLLTVRVVFQERRRLQEAVESGTKIMITPVMLLGALTLGVWVLPQFVNGHAAEILASAFVVLISQLTVLAVEKKFRTLMAAHEIIPGLVLCFIMAWVYSNSHFQAVGHGEEFLAAATVGASSMHAWQTVTASILRVVKMLS